MTFVTRSECRVGLTSERLCGCAGRSRVVFLIRMARRSWRRTGCHFSELYRVLDGTHAG